MEDENTAGQELLGTEVPEIPTPGDEQSAESSPPANQEILDIINRFAPGEDVSSDQAVIAAALKVLKNMEPIYNKLYDLALGSPETASFLLDLIETGTVAKALARNYDPDEVQALMEEVTDGSNEEDRTTHMEKVAKSKSRQDMISGNMEISTKNISEFMESRKHWPPEKAEEFEQKVIKHYEDGADGLISQEDLVMLEKGFYHDDDVAEAEENGKVVGLNEQIVNKRASKKEKESLLPDLNGGAIKPVTAEKEETPFMSSLRQIADKKPILS